MLSDCKFDCTCRVLEGVSLARIKSFFRKKNATLPLALCLSGFARWHYGGISGIFGRFLIIFVRNNKLKSEICARFLKICV